MSASQTQAEEGPERSTAAGFSQFQRARRAADPLFQHSPGPAATHWEEAPQRSTVRATISSRRKGKV